MTTLLLLALLAVPPASVVPYYRPHPKRQAPDTACRATVVPTRHLHGKALALTPLPPGDTVWICPTAAPERPAGVVPTRRLRWRALALTPLPPGDTIPRCTAARRTRCARVNSIGVSHRRARGG